MNYGLHGITKETTLSEAKCIKQTRVGLSDGSTWKARSGKFKLVRDRYELSKNDCSRHERFESSLSFKKIYTR